MGAAGQHGPPVGAEGDRGDEFFVRQGQGDGLARGRASEADRSPAVSISLPSGLKAPVWTIAGCCIVAPMGLQVAASHNRAFPTK